MAVAIQSSLIEIGKTDDEIQEQERPISPKKKDGVKFSIGGGSPQRTSSRLQPTLMAPIKRIYIHYPLILILLCSHLYCSYFFLSFYSYHFNNFYN